MENRTNRTLPRWLFVLLSIVAAWASGIYLGKISIEETISPLLIPTIGFGVLAFLMGWGAISNP